MKVTVVGSSCSWFTRANTSFIIDDKILFDISAGNYKHIIKSIDIFNLDWIFISHLHDDHFFDFRVIATRFIREQKRYSRTEKLRVYCPSNTAETVVKINSLMNCAPDETSLEILRQSIDFIDLRDGMQFEENGYKIKVYAMNHNGVETYGLTFMDKNDKTYAFSSDTTLCDNLHKMLSISDYAFVDMASSKLSKSHIYHKDFLELEKKYPNCKMFPIHTCDETQKFAEENGMNFVRDGQILNLE